MAAPSDWTRREFLVGASVASAAVAVGTSVTQL